MTQVVAKSYAVTATGIGKPDYTREVSAGLERPGLALKYNQSLKYFGRSYTSLPSAFPFITPPLGAGVAAHIIDAETGLAMPFTVPKGYTLTAITAGFHYTQDAILWFYLDGYVLANFGCPAARSVNYFAHIVAHGTAMFDPTGATSHTVDIQVTNQGASDLEGGGSVYAILEAVGTGPLPMTKVVRCKFCGHEDTVPRETTHWICPKCSQLNLYFNLSGFRGT